MARLTREVRLLAIKTPENACRICPRYVSVNILLRAYKYLFQTVKECESRFSSGYPSFNRQRQPHDEIKDHHNF